MEASYEEIDDYLERVRTLLSKGKFRLDNRREKNAELFETFVISEQDAIDICMNLTPADFCNKTQNEHSGFEHEILYIFRKDLSLLERFTTTERIVTIYIKFNNIDDNFLVIISFHEAERELLLYSEIHPDYIKY